MQKLALPIAELKRKIATEPDTSKVLNFFLDEFANRDEFIESGHPVEVPAELEYGFDAIVSKLRNGVEAATSWKLMNVPLAGLLHGVVHLDCDQTATVLWAPELSMGIVAIHGRGLTGTAIARISVTGPSKVN